MSRRQLKTSKSHHDRRNETSAWNPFAVGGTLHQKAPYSLVSNRRSLRKARIFSRASSSGTITPSFWVEGSSRLRMLTERDSISCCPTTKIKLY